MGVVWVVFWVVVWGGVGGFLEGVWEVFWVCLDGVFGVSGRFFYYDLENRTPQW